MMSVSISSVVLLEPVPETLLMLAEANLRLVIPSCPLEPAGALPCFSAALLWRRWYLTPRMTEIAQVKAYDHFSEQL
jgi:hypothetical protein